MTRKRVTRFLMAAASIAGVIVVATRDTPIGQAAHRARAAFEQRVGCLNL